MPLVDLQRMILCTANSLVDEHQKAALEAFSRSIFNLYSSKPVEPDSSFTESLKTSDFWYVMPQMTYRSSPTVVPTYDVSVKRGAPVMVIGNILPMEIVSGKTLLL